LHHEGDAHIIARLKNTIDRALRFRSAFANSTLSLPTRGREHPMKHRTLAFFATALVSALIGGLVATSLDPVRATSRNILRAEKFELTDSQGNLRGVFTASGPDERHTLLRLYGKDRSSLMLLVNPSTEGGSQISFFDANDRRVLNLQESRDLSQTRRPASRGAEPPGQKEKDLVDKGGNVDLWDEILRLDKEIEDLRKRLP
jgi:hypothetical protein